ncbi:MAG TPA: hypothetical protein VMZ71_06535, partial [Gemmataceae bacterium]|nr:hypothetical protein [Gemmataceae bacterium]
MSETPRQSAILAALFAPDPDVRTATILAHVADPVAAASAGLGPRVRARLSDPDPAVRLTAADYLWRVSGDPAPAVAELCDRCRREADDEMSAALPLLGLLGKHAAGVLVEFARGLPAFFNGQPDDFLMWAASTVLTAGPHGPALLKEMLVESSPRA